jgi:hypothetical protein
LHKNNVLKRPDTANRNSGNLTSNMHNTEDEGVLGLFDESHHSGS